MDELLQELIAYGSERGLVDPDDRIYTLNRLLEIFGSNDYDIEKYPLDQPPAKHRPLQEILDDLTDMAAAAGITPGESTAERDLFDTKLMGALTPPPSSVREHFSRLLSSSPKEATDWYYQFSRDTNYIRTDRIARDRRWKTDTKWGTLDITINLSKPEKSPKDIAAAGRVKSSGYPACLLCMENEGYAGHAGHPARQNHRIIPLKLSGEDYFLQYSPYVYYNEHCIVFNKKHIPMRIDQGTFKKLLSFTEQFPHYTLGSNADLPIVGGSILSHDHFQGGGYEFPMVRAGSLRDVAFAGYGDVKASVLKWPLTTIRLDGADPERVSELAGKILRSWRGYTDESAGILAQTDGTPHSTITPIARRRGDDFELDLVLRNNLTTDEFPQGVFHSHPEYHHIKRENIGLIEVMGLAVLPARLKNEMADLENEMLNGGPVGTLETTAPHRDWALQIMKDNDITRENIHSIMKREIGLVFSRVLENCGVFGTDIRGQEALDRFLGQV